MRKLKIKTTDIVNCPFFDKEIEVEFECRKCYFFRGVEQGHVLCVCPEHLEKVGKNKISGWNSFHQEPNIGDKIIVYCETRNIYIEGIYEGNQSIITNSNSYFGSWDKWLHVELCEKKPVEVCEYCNNDATPTCCDKCLNDMVHAKQINQNQGKLNPKEWFEQIYVQEMVEWGTNTFTDNVVVDIIERYVKYLNETK